jgi:hypothetical protein
MGSCHRLRYVVSLRFIRCAIFNLFPGVVQIQEPMPAETFEPHRRVEAFDLGVVSRPAWPAEVQRDVAAPTPRSPRSRPKRRSSSASGRIRTMPNMSTSIRSSPASRERDPAVDPRRTATIRGGKIHIFTQTALVSMVWQDEIASALAR